MARQWFEPPRSECSINPAGSIDQPWSADSRKRGIRASPADGRVYAGHQPSCLRAFRSADADAFLYASDVAVGIQAQLTESARAKTRPTMFQELWSVCEGLAQLL